MGELLKQSVVPMTRNALWSRMGTAAGINDELYPWLKMTVPAALRGRDLDVVALREPLGRSWFLLLGFIPIDFDAIVVAERESGERFVETSTMASMRAWRHERTLADHPAGTLLTDRVTFELRRPLAAVPGLSVLVERVLSALFAHRHRRLGGG